jgi:aminobenzoyl-glutamate utilization protein B
MKKIIAVFVLSLACVFSPHLLAADTLTQAPLDSADQATLDFIDSRYEQVATISSQLWEYAEVGYQEEKSTAVLQKALADEGFSIETGVAGIPTAFVASYGSGQPVIAILAEMDALPGINQAAVPTRQLVEGKDAGQACGHHLFGAGSTEAAIAVAQWLKRTGNQGTIRLYGTPAEEGGSGKVYMVRAGLFDDVDAAIHWHPSDRNTAAAETTLANRSAKFRFYGVSAHAAGAPEKARSALDGVEAFNFMSNMMREHVPQETRIHYVITKGGNAPNVVPDFAEVFYYLRHPDASQVRILWERLEEAALGAAQGTGTKVEWEIIHGNHPLLLNETLSLMMDTKLRAVGGITYNAEEQVFADEIYSTFTDPVNKMGSEAEIGEFKTGLSYGSTDVGDVSIAVPTVGIEVATWVPGTSAHSWQAVAAGGTTIGYKGASNAAKAMALGAIELLQNEELLIAARAEFDEQRGGDYHYEALLGDREPPLDYRK